MSVSREPATAPAGGSFEVTGRWYGIRGRRFLRPTLDVEVDGAPRRMLAVLEHKPWAADDGEEWVAAFDWTGEPVELAVAELVSAREAATAGRDAAVAARDEAAAARDAALADAEKAVGERDKAVRQKAVLEKELAATARARDKARAERNEWLTRARDAAAGQGPAAREGGGAAREAGGGAAREAGGGAAREGVAGAAQAARQAVSRRLGAARRPEAEPAGSEDVSGPSEAASGAPAEDAATAPLPRHKGLAPPPAPPNKPRKEQIPPGGILLPPTHPGSHMRRSLIPAWAPRVLAPLLLVALVVVIALLIGWAL